MRFRYVRTYNLSEVWDYWQNKADGTHNRPENGNGAWVALCAHSTYTETDTDIHQ
jgi:hypothetical protein